MNTADDCERRYNILSSRVTVRLIASLDRAGLRLLLSEIIELTCDQHDVIKHLSSLTVRDSFLEMS